ncbi:phage minor capsid protein [Anaerovorax sp. IOR16]|uniref:phage minor capsid protein n=1 Tax=Anaerovorax sp. IOR16 TaxID=2773458 RepID=UPI00246935FA|nr:phage minor capsid protein [Anaerovorax sp. IOR16]
MLTPKQLDKLPDNLVVLYSKAETDIIIDMARRITTYDYFIPAAQWQYIKAREMGLLHDEIIKRLSYTTGISNSQIEQLMKDAGAEALKTDDAIYKSAGLSPKPLSASPKLQTVLATGIEKTQGLFRNLAKTTANTATKQFENMLDRVYMQITTSAFDYNSSIRMAIKDLASKGVATIQYPSGHVDYMEVAVRRATVTGVNQTAAKLQEARADEMGGDLVETTAHAGARPDHAEWQGKIFSRSGKHPKYPDFVSSTGYGTGEGLCGWNCRHNFYPFFEGVSEPVNTKKELEEMNALKYEYNGNNMTEYEASQKQRHIERQIRRWKREYVGMEAAGLPTDEAAAKVSQWNRVQNDFLKQTGLKLQNERSQIAEFSKKQAGKVSVVTRKINSYQSVIGVVTPTGIKVTAVSKHFGERCIGRNVSAKDVQDALINPMKVGKIKAKDNGVSQEFFGEKARVQINPETGNLITTWKTSNKLRNKLKGGHK